MTFSRFMLYVAYKKFLISKACSKGFGICEITTSIVAYVNNQSVTRLKMKEYIVKVTCANSVLEGFTANIADIIIKDCIV